MVSRKIKLEDVEAAFHEMETGNVIRSVIEFN
jgi:Zn-dependent alcohol dehydrogenase